MPDGAETRIWENIQKAISGNAPASNGNGETSGRQDSATGQASNSVGQTTVQASVNTGMTLTTKIIIGIIAAAVITTAVLIIPPLLESPPKETLTSVVTDVSTITQTEAIQTTMPAPTSVNIAQTATRTINTTEQQEETTQDAEQETTDNAVIDDDNRAPAPMYLRFEKSDEGNMVYWWIQELHERVEGFEFSAASLGTDDWKAFVAVPADYGGYKIETIAAYLDDGEYKIKLTSLSSEGFIPSEPAYIENGTLTVRTGDHPKNRFTIEKFDTYFSIFGFDEHLTLYYLIIKRNGVLVDYITWFDTNWRNDLGMGYDACAFENGFGGSQPGDVITIRELTDVAFDGENYTVTFSQASDPIVIP
jgi:hypothetical protein